MAESYLLLVAELIFMFLGVIYLVRHYKAPNVEYPDSLATYVSWSLGFAGILLLPYDIAVALVQEREVSLRTLWDTIYWSTFILAWLILPVQLSYQMSGHFTMSGKLYEALLSNALSSLFGFVCFVAFVIYMLSTNGGSLDAVQGFMIAMANTYGLMIVIVLMGNGLVALPRRVWEMGNTSQELVRLYMLATSVDTAFHDARFDLEDCEIEAKRLKPLVDASGVDLELKGYFCIIEEAIQDFEFQGKSSSRKYSKHPSETKNNSRDDNLEKALVSLYGKLLSAQRRILSINCRWNNLVEAAKYLEEITSGSLKPEASSWCEMRTKTYVELSNDTRSRGSLRRMHDSVRLRWRIKFYPLFCKCCAVVLAGASAMIFWSEMTMAIQSMDSPVGKLLNHLSDGGAGIFMVQFFACLALAYMSVCSYWAMFSMNLGWAFTLQSNQSPSTSLLFNATYFCRLQFSLAFNFLLMLNNGSRMTTSFEGLFASMEVVPLFGAEFTVYAPVIICVVGLLTFLNVYARILKVIGIESEDAVTGGCTACHKLDADDIELIAIGKKHVSTHIRSLQSHDGTNLADLSRNGKRNKDTVLLLPNHVVVMDDVENPLAGVTSVTTGRGRASMTSRASAPENHHVNANMEVEMPMSRGFVEHKSVESSEASTWGGTGGWGSSDPLVETVGWGAPSTFLKPNAASSSKQNESAKYSSISAAESPTSPAPVFSDDRFKANAEEDPNRVSTTAHSATMKSYGGRYKR
jgi:hypothetical protein